MKWQTDYSIIEAGCDEAGRGCLAGPVVAAAVILPKTFFHPLLNDSKQVNKKNRNLLKKIIQKESLAYGIGICSPEEIDEINILQASIKAMHKALTDLKIQPQNIAVDGNYFKPWEDVPYECCVKGDANYMNIAAASILAKTFRDELMINADKIYPQYKWRTNKGYPTKQHRQAIEEFGLTYLHRKTFKIKPTKTF